MHAVAIDQEKLQKLGYGTNAIPFDAAFDRKIILHEWDTTNRKISSPIWRSLFHFRSYFDEYNDSTIKLCGGQDVHPLYKLDRTTINTLQNALHNLNCDENIPKCEADKEAYNESLALFAWARDILDKAKAFNMKIIIAVIPDM